MTHEADDYLAGLPTLEELLAPHGGIEYATPEALDEALDSLKHQIRLRRAAYERRTGCMIIPEAPEAFLEVRRWWM